MSNRIDITADKQINNTHACYARIATHISFICLYFYLYVACTHVYNHTFSLLNATTSFIHCFSVCSLNVSLTFLVLVIRHFSCNKEKLNKEVFTFLFVASFSCFSFKFNVLFLFKYHFV